MGTPIVQEGTSSNRYTILGRLAGGGMADIFLARSANESGIERYVVLKRVLAERSRDPHFATMFLDEARLAAQLQHPNIAQVHDIGKLGGSYFYTMEYVHGEDVRHVMARLSALRRKLPVNLALHAATGALAGLQHAHTRTGSDGKPLGVIHRDVSPSNVMISFEGGVKLLDFGVAKAAQRSAESRAGTIKGKIMYLSPEQCQGGTIDQRSDIYALGIVLHEMLTGKRLYKRETEFQTMMAIVSEQSPPPSSLRPDVSPEIDAIVLTALSKDPAQRYANANEMIEAIEAVAVREGLGLSVTSAGKFMRELFGERPEPWLELAAREEDPKQVTVTGESLGSLDALSGVAIAAAFSPSGAVMAAQALEAQLDQAPAIGRPPDPDHSPVGTLQPAPLAFSQPPPMEPQRYSAALPAGHRARPPTMTPLQTPVAAYSTGGSSEPTPIWRRRPFVIGASALTVVIVIAIISTLFGGARTPAPPMPPVGSAAVVTGPEPMIADGAVIAPSGSNVGSNAIASSGSGEPNGSAVASPDPTIAATFAAGNWQATVELCARTSSLSNPQRIQCAVAACNAKQRGVALGYAQAASGAAQQRIERECRDAGVTLRSQRTQTTSPPKNPCDDKQYREQNPLKCQ